MTTRSKIIVTSALLLILGGLGAADYLSDNALTGDIAGEPTDTETSGNDEPLPEGAVRKNTGPEVSDAIAAVEDFSTDESEDLSLITQIVKDGTPVRGLAILHDGDRAGSVTWVESGNVKNYFMALKEALLGTFSPDVTGLKDETLQEEGAPVRNLLTFTDPALSEEKLVFIRVRERLYEFHVADGKDAVMSTLIEELTTK